MKNKTGTAEVRADIVIIGAGLSGLTLNYLLKDSGLNVVLLEARDRIGGRILTLKKEDEPTVEMGATWFGNKHLHLIAMLKELKLERFIQELGATAIYEYMSTSPPQLVALPDNDDPSFRIKGGTTALIDALASHLEQEKLFTGTVVDRIVNSNNGLLVATNGETFLADKVVSTLPPHLFHKNVTVSPQLPRELQELMSSTHTWMGESIKFGFTYKEPFWRAQGTSGTVFSNTGPVTEMYDHSDFEDTHHALKGFLNGNYYSLTREERRELILRQLRKYYGSKADTFTDYHECVWAKEPFTYVPYDAHVLPHQHNGNPLYRNSWLDGQLLISGSETAKSFPGYMDGAVESARWVCDQILGDR
ncbi:flavin monoamine oxidase family protein [Robertkochia sediminum]|uniref:flavin monoamine oxidase family protein n=1 Tax=Robertkochia sediminum TaxID=2785326 RepID=UPI0019324C0B|nr:NAD(P)/FAD-dependent oxidoreductase [Robertkochia sediminum]MBL7473244.1 FAD-dependent oxidoreductase [Robertkochia sediminum]